MLTNLRQYQEQVEKIVDSTWQKGEDLQAWSAFHQSQLRYFGQARQVYVVLAAACGVTMAVSLMLAVVTQNAWLWLICLLMGCSLIGVSYYLALYNRALRALEVQAVVLFQSALAMKNKPWLAVGQKLLDLAAQFFAKKI